MKKLITLLATTIVLAGLLAGCTTETTTNTGASFDVTIKDTADGNVAFDAAGKNQIAVKSGSTVTINLKNSTNKPEIAHLHGSNSLLDSKDKVIEGNSVTVQPGQTVAVKIQPKDFKSLEFHGHGNGTTKLSGEQKPLQIVEQK